MKIQGKTQSKTAKFQNSHFKTNQSIQFGGKPCQPVLLFFSKIYNNKLFFFFSSFILGHGLKNYKPLLVYSYLVYRYFLNNVVSVCEPTTQNKSQDFDNNLHPITWSPATSPLPFHPPVPPYLNSMVFLSLLYFYKFFFFFTFSCF